MGREDGRQDVMRWLKTFLKPILALRQRAGVALIVALMTPMLIATTGLSVGVGYWYEQQESLQVAADAAALAGSLNDGTLAQTTASAKATAATPLAIAAANAATNNQFSFAGAGNATIALTAAVPSASATTYTAVATIPRSSFFTKSGGPMFGLGAGVQQATATAELKTTTTGSAGACIYSTSSNAAQAIYASGGAKINSSNCGIYVNSTACNANNGEADAVVADPSATITAASVSTQGCIYANTNGGAYVGGANNNTSTNYNGAAAQADPLAAMGNAPLWPTMPNTPAAPANTTYTPAPSLGYNTYSGSQGDCTYMGNYSANCELFQGALSGLNNVGVNSLVLNENTSSGTTYISGGLTVNANNFLRLNGNTYDIAGGVSLTTSGTNTMAAGNYNFLGGTTLTNGTHNIGVGTSYFSGASTASGAASTWGLDVNTPNFTLGAGTYYFNGGAEFPGSNPQVTMGQGTYLLSAYPGNTNASNSSGGGALNDNNANITFTGGTYYFDGGLTVQGNGTVTFGPGIYYIRNGSLNFIAGSHVTANNVTFILEGTASYQMNGGTAALNLTAPTTNCVQPAAYPVSTYSLPASNPTPPNAYAPYDGTGGEGICGVLIYQARGDTAADAITEGATSTITGILYAPSASLAVSGGATISAATSNGAAGTLAFIQSTFSLTGSGTINVSAANGSGVGSSTTTTTQSLLVN